MHVLVHEMKLDFIQDLFSKAYAGDWSIQDAPLKVERIQKLEKLQVGMNIWFFLEGS